MFLLQEILRFNQRRQTEGIKRLQWIHSLMQPHPGFVKGQISRYLGNPTDYLILRMWDSQDAYQKFRESPDGNYGKSRPEGLYEGVPVGRMWELAIDTQGGVPGNFLVRSIYQPAEGRAQDFIENRKRHDKLFLQVPRQSGIQTWQCTDTEGIGAGTFLCLARRVDRDAYNEYLESPQAEEYRKGNERGLYKTVSTELFEVVDEVTPAK